MDHRRVGRSLAAVLVLASAPVAAVPAAALEPSGTVEVVRVRIVDNRFRPGSITVDRGTVVKWRNRGTNDHTTTSNGGLWDSGTLSPGESFRRRFRQVGTFRYHCEIHSTMRGTITVV